MSKMGFAMVGKALAAELSAAFDIARGLYDIDDAARVARRRFTNC
jgi:hypothetical protein